MALRESYPKLGVPSALLNKQGDYILKSHSLIKLQVYSADVKRLNDKLTLFNPDEFTGSAVNLLMRTSTVYAQLEENVRIWDQAFKKIIELSSGIYQYSQILETYGKAIEEIISFFRKNKDNQNSSLKLTSRFNKLREILQKEIDGIKDDASSIENNIEEVLLKNYTKDENDLNNLINEFKQELAKLTDLEPQIENDLRKEIDEAQELLEIANNKYELAALRAELTISYGWIPLVGWVVSTIIKKSANNEMKEAELTAKAQAKIIKDKTQELEVIEEQQEKKQQLLNVFRKLSIERTASKTQNAIENLNNVLDLLKNVKEALISLEPEFTILGGLINNAEVENIDFITFIKEWKNLANKVDDWRDNAYVAFSEMF